MKLLKGVCLSLITVLLFCLTFVKIGEAKKYIKWGATSVRSGLYANTVAMAKAVNQEYGKELKVVVMETGGFMDNLARLKRKAIDLGPADAAAGYANYVGIIDFKNKKNPNL